MSRVVCISDTHGQHAALDVPDGDVLLFAGDACSAGTPGEWRAFCRWLADLPHAHKVVVPGNHDWPIQPSVPAWGLSARYGPATLRHARRRVEDAGAVLLVDRETTVDGLRVYGSPRVPAFHRWAFNLPRGGSELTEVWSRVPERIDVLVNPRAGLRDPGPHRPRRPRRVRTALRPATPARRRRCEATAPRPRRHPRGGRRPRPAPRRRRSDNGQHLRPRRPLPPGPATHRPRHRAEALFLVSQIV